jgi:penicillin amidase
MKFKSALFGTVLILQGCVLTDVSNNQLSPATASLVTDNSIKLYRDNYGTPHIFANSNFDLFTGYGYAVAQDRLFQMEMLKRTTQGKVAEVLGKEYIAYDHYIRSQFQPDSIKKQIEKLSSAQLDVLNGYAHGMNLWLKKIKHNSAQLLPLEFTQHQFKPSNWTTYDVAMIFVGTLAMRYADFNTELENLTMLQELNTLYDTEKSLQLFNALMWQCDVNSITTVHKKSNDKCLDRQQIPGDLSVTSPLKIAVNSYINTSGKIDFSPDSKSKWLKDFAKTGLSGDITRSSASNIWMLSKNKLKDANGVMLNGPQFGWANPSYVYGIGLHGGDYDIVGNTLLATPNILFGHNNHIAWGSTAGFGDQVDIIQLNLVKNTADPAQLSYSYQGKVYPLTQRQEIIKVKDDPAIKFTVNFTHLGAIEHLDQASGHIYIRRRTWQGSEVESMLAWLDIGKAHNWSEFRQQVSHISTNINFYYMDLQGNLGYILGGKYPIRSAQQHVRLPMTESTDWQGFQDFKANPFAYRPANNFIMNWNNRPESKLASPDMWWMTWNKADRGNEIHERLSQQDKWSTEEVWQLNEEMSFVDTNIRYLLPLLEQAHKDHPLRSEAAKGLSLLQNWDRAWRDKDHDGYFDSKATTLMQHWLTQLLKDVLSDDLPDEMFKKYAATGYPIATIRGSIKPQPGTAILVDTFSAQQAGRIARYDFLNGKTALDVIRSSFNDVIEIFTRNGTLNLPETEVYPLKFSPYNFRGILQGSSEHTLNQIMNRGSENNLFIATDDGFQAWDVIPSGQSAFINQQSVSAPHTTDQLSMYEDFKRKPVYWSESELQKQGFKMEIIEMEK